MKAWLITHQTRCHLYHLTVINRKSIALWAFYASAMDLPQSKAKGFYSASHAQKIESKATKFAKNA